MTDGLRTCNYIKKSKIPNAEWGVFAGKNFKKGDIVEKNIFIEESRNMLRNNVLNSYYFRHPKIINYYIFTFGNISIMNHSALYSNADAYHFDYGTRIQTCYATKDVNKDEEIFINYGNSYNSYNF